MAITGIIDPPSPYAPAEEWRAFLAVLQKMPEGEERDAAIAEAEAKLAELEGDEPDLQEMEDIVDDLTAKRS